MTTAAVRSPGAGDVNGDGFDDLIVGASAPIPDGRPMPARAMWCSARRGLRARASISPRSTARTASASTGSTTDDQRRLGRRRGGRQRRRHRRPDRRGAMAATADGSDAGESYVVFGTAARLRGKPRSLGARRHERLPPRRDRRVRPQRLLGRGGGRRQRRRLRRPDHRGLRRRSRRTAPVPARAMWSSARHAGFAASLDLSALDGIERLPPRRHRRG